MSEPEAARLRQLPIAVVLGCEFPVANTLRSRLLGLAHLERAEAGPGLLIPRCSTVHTFGMRFALDIYFLDAAGAPLAMRSGLPARRAAFRAGARAVLEVPAAKGGESRWRVP
jgi:uncharacterized membrane protein (UPF0127 family)